jgi:hypothetical protein
MLARNYFARTAALATVRLPPPPPGATPAPVVPIAGVNSADNAYDPDSRPGNFPLAATQLPTPRLDGFDPANGATFLRFPSGPPEVGGKKVGAP